MSIENNINEKVKALAVHIAQKMGELKAKVDQYDELEIAGLEEVRSKTNGIIESLGLVDDGNGNYSYDAETFLNNIPIDAVTNSVAQSLIVGDDDFEVVDIFKTDAEGYLVDAEGNQLLDAENNPTKDPEAVVDQNSLVKVGEETSPSKEETTYSAAAVDEKFDDVNASIDDITGQVDSILDALGLGDDGDPDNDVTAEKLAGIADAISVLQTKLNEKVSIVKDVPKTDAEGYLVDAEGNQLLDAENNPTKDPEAVADPSQIVYEQITEDGTVADLLSSVAQNSDLIAANAEAIAANAAAIEDLQEDIATLNTADDYSMLFDVYYETGLSGDITELSSDDVLTNYTNTENNLINITGVENPVIVNLMTASNTLKVTA